MPRVPFISLIEPIDSLSAKPYTLVVVILDGPVVDERVQKTLSKTSGDIHCHLSSKRESLKTSSLFFCSNVNRDLSGPFAGTV